MTFIESVEAALDREDFKGRPALLDPYGKLTFEQLRNAIDKTLRRLKLRGCRRGDRVAALSFSCTQAVVLEWATYKLGGIWIGIPWRERRPDVVASILKACRPKLFFLDPAALNVSDLDFLLMSSDLGLQKVGSFRHLECFRTRLGSQRQKVAFKIDGEDIARIRFTSGVAGQPKGITYTQQTQKAILDNISEAVIESRGEVMIHGAPTAWASGSLIAPVLCSGGCNVLRPKWVTESFVEAVWREECTLTFLVPKMLASLVEYCERYGSEWARSLDRILLAGGPTPVLTMRRARRFFTHIQFYTTVGMTEASFPITWHKVDANDVNSKSRPYIPLGSFTQFYEGSQIAEGRKRGELEVKGLKKSNAVARGKLVWLNDDGSPLKIPRIGKLKTPYKSGDIVERKGGLLHYVCRKDESCIKQNIFIAIDAFEALLRDCPGVREARIDRIWKGKPLQVDVTIQSALEGVNEQTIRRYFQRNASKANLRQIDIGTICFGTVEITASGKIVHNKALCRGEFRGGLNKSQPQPWKPFAMGKAKNQELAFSQIQSGPLYFYVGAGLSMSSGLVGWGEMASIVWWYLKHYENKDPLAECPPDVGKANAEFLNRFVTRDKILSHASKNSNGLSRTALLNLILRYRAPKTILEMSRQRKPRRKLQEDRTHYGKEPNAEDLVLQSLIWRTRCHGVFTSNYDMLLEHAFSLFNHGAALRSYRYNADFLRYLMSNKQFVLKLHGDINDIGRMQLSPEKAWKNDKLFAQYGDDLKEAYSTALQSGHMIYLGMGFRDETILRLHKAWRNRKQPSANLRVALIPHRELREIRKNLGNKLEWFDDILFLTYGDNSTNGMVRDHAVREFLSQIVQARPRQTHEERGPCPEARDLHRQIFLSSPSESLSRHFSTEPWTCKDIPVRH